MADLYGQGLYGSGAVVVGARTTGSSGGSVKLNILFLFRSECQGSSDTTASVVRVRRASAVTDGESASAPAIVRRRPVSGTTNGESATTLIQSIRIRQPRLITTGSGTAQFRPLMFVKSVRLVTAGSSTAAANILHIILPPPGRSIRVGPWTSPALNVNLRFTRWTSY